MATSPVRHQSPYLRGKCQSVPAKYCKSCCQDWFCVTAKRQHIAMRAWTWYSNYSLRQKKMSCWDLKHGDIRVKPHTPRIVYKLISRQQHLSTVIVLSQECPILVLEGHYPTCVTCFLTPTHQTQVVEKPLIVLQKPVTIITPWIKSGVLEKRNF